MLISWTRALAQMIRRVGRNRTQRAAHVGDTGVSCLQIKDIECRFGSLQCTLLFDLKDRSDGRPAERNERSNGPFVPDRDNIKMRARAQCEGNRTIYRSPHR